MSALLPDRAATLLRKAMHGLRDEAGTMAEDEIDQQPIVLGHLRLADQIERYLEKSGKRYVSRRAR